MTDVNNGCMIYTPTLAERFWRALGYRCRGVPEETPEMEGLRGWMMQTVVWRVSLLDRLRLLIGGRVRVRVLTKTDVEIGEALSVSTFELVSPVER